MTTRLATTGASAAAAALLLAGAGGAGSVREGGTLRVAVAAGAVTTIDPALIDFPPEVRLLDPACGSLVDYPDKPPPDGGRLRPDLAEAEPSISRDGKTYTFRVRKDARFSNGAPVTARAFERAIERLLDPAMKAFGASDFASVIVGGEDVLAGKATTPRGVSASGNVLTLRLTKRDPVFQEWMVGFCAVPPALAADPEGAKAPLPSAAPYYVAEYVPGERLVLERNRFYRGNRPHHVDRINANLGADAKTVIDDIASGKLDWGDSPVALRARAGELAQQYKTRFFAPPQPFLRMFVLNTSRPLFRNNPQLRQAVNFAVDRRALTRELGPHAGVPTDQYLLPSQAGYRDVRIYPLKGPHLRRARQLARSHMRSGKAVLYTTSDPVDIAQAQVLQRNLKAIGVDLEIKTFPSGQLLFEKMSTEGHLFDIGRISIGYSSDPSWFSGIFHGRTIGRPGNSNWSYFSSPKYNRLFDAASRLMGDERYRAYGELDVQLSRDAAPAIPIANLTAPTFVSARVGCIVLNPWLVLSAVCLK